MYPVLDKEKLLQLFVGLGLDASAKNWQDRRVWIESQDSYEDPQYRVWFFYIEGSPPKAAGMVTSLGNGWRLTYTDASRVTRTRYVDFNGRRTVRAKALERTHHPIL